MLAEAIPALSNPVGRNPVEISPSSSLSFENYDMQNRNDPELPIFLTEWPHAKNKLIQVYDPGWLHSDMKDLSYVYISKLYDEIVCLTN